MSQACRVYVGTSGWHYKHWVGDFYPERHPPAKMLSYYAREFGTVEINNSFYRLPEASTFRQWKEQVPRGFIFALKASRFISHIKRLREPKDSIDLLLQRAEPLGDALGPVLFQLPPNWKLDIERLRGFLEALPKPLQVTLEFRDPSWNNDHVYELLREHNVAHCLHDWREMPWPQDLTADFTYIRFHGSGQRYGGDYPEKVLWRWAEKIDGWRDRLKQVYVYFNNDTGGHAIHNVRSLRQMLEQMSNPDSRIPSLKSA